ncbi:ribosome small subunit-dependent GTPase A [Salinibacterium hongtaonis]|uniref:Small ribosomal subunit biogenesis GTPase RsgA n=1 Tax=Homoserinimonas hongtaonis TaxID=2079791 RepID=A0A2U1SX14_9MICO|nr:ribosome small subunit-dependent GTPase A [Salinibacterium hongtaonis]AWB88774.1 ribosome small subunit-dependent GTPase A [Salinibacterium hongtaonis]PWB96175.1 ribosome small subunit-dependent GTPase A [Salinibacterium hongtaonis]
MSWINDTDDDDPYADYEAKSRPNPKGNKPRTKTRPQHEDAVIARVLTVDRGRYSVLVDEDGPNEHPVTAARARELRRQSIVTGDRVDIVGDTTGDEGSLARIVRIRERETVLRRSADDTDEVERIIVANADQMLIVVAAANPEPRTRLVHRYLVAAFDAGITPILCITKTDLADPADFLKDFAGLDLEIITSSSDDPPIAELNAVLTGHSTVAVGHSGVGKSTLVNALVPDANRATGHVNEVTGRGRHTSSSTISYRVADGWIIDTPGVRSFGLGHVNIDNVLRSFPDLEDIAAECPRGCTHLPGSIECELIERVEAGELGDVGRLRLDSFQRMMAALR